MTRTSRRSTALAAGLLTVLLCGSDASADQSRITVVFRPAAATNPVAVEIARSAPRQGAALPSLKLTGGPSGLRLGGYATPLPAIKLQGLSLAPRYGDQQYTVDFQPAALAGMTPGARAVRGLAVTLSGRGVSGTLLAGRLSGEGAGLLESAVPNVLAFSATLKLIPRLAVSPRLATALASDGKRVDSTLGLGLRADVSPHVAILADAGKTRTKSGGRARLATIGALGRWSRVSLEASASRADAGADLLGPVPFAALDRRTASARVVLVRGVSVESRLTTSRPVDGPKRRDATMARSTIVRIDRLRAGSLLVGVNGDSTARGRTDDLTAEWRRRGSGGASIQFRQQRDGTGTRSARRLQFEIPAVPTGNARLKLGVRSSMALSGAGPAHSRSTTRIKGRVAAAARLGLTVEADVDAAASFHSIVRVTRLATGAEIGILHGTEIQVMHTYRPGEPLRAWRQFELRLGRTLSF